MIFPQAPLDAPIGDASTTPPRLGLSALLDGELNADDSQSVQRACSLWRDDAQARHDWHAWHLIGDVMRSDELARAPARDVAFLSRLRERLATEPVVLAPAVLAAPAPAAVPRRRSLWMLPTAMAAGFAAVAVVLLVARTGPPAAAPGLASGDASGLSLASVPGSIRSSAAADSALLRDPRLDSYLRAHQTARGSPAAAVPGGGMRNVEATLMPGAER